MILLRIPTAVNTDHINAKTVPYQKLSYLKLRNIKNKLTTYSTILCVPPVWPCARPGLTYL